MTVDEEKLKELRAGRIRRVKRWLRPLPRRANIHRYPGLKYFAETARKRSYLWSFRFDALIPALYAGTVLALLPLFGVQLPLAFILALLLRANLPVLAGLQLITNPLTILPIYFSSYQIGRYFLGIFGAEVSFLGRRRFEEMLLAVRDGNWGENFQTLASVFGVTFLGGAIVGLFIATVLVAALKVVVKRGGASYHTLTKKIHDSRAHAAETAAAGAGAKPSKTVEKEKPPTPEESQKT